MYYVGTQPDHDGIAKILDALTAGADVKPLIPDETELEVDLRTIEGREYWFIINLTGTPKSAPESFRGETDILTGTPVEELQGFDTVIVRR